MDRLQWSAPEYDEKERSSDWFWALGVIVIASSVAAAIYENYFFAVLIILSGVLLGFFAKRKPEIVSYELNQKGLKIRGSLYPYENIKAFWVQVEHSEEERQEHGGEIKPLLFIKSERVFMPEIAIPIDVTIAEEIHSRLTEKDVPEKEMHEHPSERIIDSLGF